MARVHLRDTSGWFLDSARETVSFSPVKNMRLNFPWKFNLLALNLLKESQRGLPDQSVTLKKTDAT
jgi:hypothetical protein